MEENVIKKMCYIDDIKDQIKKFVIYTILDTERLTRVFGEDKEVRDFIIEINDFAAKNDKYFLYKSINVLTVKDEVINIAWNFKRDFPIFIIGYQRSRALKHLDENFCMPAECPAELAAYLEDWKATHIAGCTELPYSNPD